MKVMSIINYKGGVGKTTIAANLACEFMNIGKRTLLIDLDAQCSLTFTFIKPDEWKAKYSKRHTIKYWFECVKKEKEVPSFKELIVTINNVDLICSDLALINIEADWEMELQPKQRKRGIRTKALNPLQKYTYIKGEIEKLGDEYDVIIIDCPPNFGFITRNAIVASDYYIIPTKFDYLSTLGIPSLNNHVNSLIETFNREKEVGKKAIYPTLLGIIGNMVSYRQGGLDASQKEYKNKLTQRKLRVFDTILRDNTKLYASSGEYQDPVIWKCTKPHSTSEKAVIHELKSLAQEVIIKAGI